MAEIATVVKNRYCRGTPIEGLQLDKVHWYSLGPDSYLIVVNVNGRGNGVNKGLGCGAYLINSKTHNDNIMILDTTYERVMPFRITEVDVEKIHD